MQYRKQKVFSKCTIVHLSVVTQMEGFRGTSTQLRRIYECFAVTQVVPTGLGSWCLRLGPGDGWGVEAGTASASTLDTTDQTNPTSPDSTSTSNSSFLSE